MPSTSLISDLRRRINDQRPVVTALTIQSSDSTCTAALIEIDRGRLIYNPVGGSASNPVDLNLAAPAYATIRDVYNALTRVTGLIVEISDDATDEHLSIDLEEFPPIDIRVQGCSIKHHYFSDYELEMILQSAVRRHNPSFTPSTLPNSETEFVLMLAQAEINRRKTTDASKRKGTTTEVGELIAIAEAFETAYANDMRRLAKAVQAVPEAPEGRIQGGDVVQGHQWRRSLRNGFLAPMGSAPPPPPPQLLESTYGDPEDDNLRLVWVRTENIHFHSYELWYDTQPDVHPARNSILRSAMLPNDVQAYRPTTSKLAGQWFSGNANYGTAMFSAWIESVGQLITQFVVPALEPEMDYYFRLYTSDINYNTVASQVVKLRTKALRCRWDQTLKATPTYGPAGTVVTCNFDSTKGAFTANHELWIGGKKVTPTVLSGTQATFIVPSFVQLTEAKDLVVVSPTQLKDILQAYFTVTAV